MRRRTQAAWLHSMAVIAAAAFTFVAGPANASDSSQVEAGRILYMRYCSACHGPNADGRGPVAKVLETPPADLRDLSKRYGSPLPAAKIASFIDGRAAVAAHGDRDMPVWGERFNDIPDEGQARERAVADRIAKIIAYIESIQQSR
jgi:mono/diheme cytochrome c family protein